MEIAHSAQFTGRLPYSLISGPNEFSEQSQRWEDRLFFFFFFSKRAADAGGETETWGVNNYKQA